MLESLPFEIIAIIGWKARENILSLLLTSHTVNEAISTIPRAKLIHSKIIKDLPKPIYLMDLPAKMRIVITNDKLCVTNFKPNMSFNISITKGKLLCIGELPDNERTYVYIKSNHKRMILLNIFDRTLTVYKDEAILNIFIEKTKQLLDIENWQDVVDVEI